MLAREAKRKKLVLKYSEKRQSILSQLKKADTLEEIFELNEKLQKLPRNSAPTRMRIVVGKQDDREVFSVSLGYVEMQLEKCLTTVHYLELLKQVGNY